MYFKVIKSVFVRLFTSLNLRKIFILATVVEIVFNPFSPVIDSTTSGNVTISCVVNHDPVVTEEEEIVNITLKSGDVKIAQLFYFKIVLTKAFMFTDLCKRIHD